MDVEEKFGLVKRNTAEIVTEEELLGLLKEKARPSGYIGFASTGKVHIAYLIPLLKVTDMIKAGFDFSILLADVHAHLDNQKSPWELLDYRFEYYSGVLSAMLSALGADSGRLKLVRGKDVQLNGKYFMDLLKLSAVTTLARARRSAQEVVKFGEDPRLSGFIYPLMQSLDEEYLGADLQLGGLDQRKILMFARESLPVLGYKQRVEVMTPMLPGLTGAKMSASDEKSKIDVLDSAEEIERKVNSAVCPAGVAEGNSVMMFLKHFLMVRKADLKKPLIIEREKKFGGDVSYSSYAALEKDFLGKKIHPADLKKAVGREIGALLEPVRKKLADKQDIIKKAYPS